MSSECSLPWSHGLGFKFLSLGLVIFGVTKLKNLEHFLVFGDFWSLFGEILCFSINLGHFLECSLLWTKPKCAKVCVCLVDFCLEPHTTDFVFLWLGLVFFLFHIFGASLMLFTLEPLKVFGWVSFARTWFCCQVFGLLHVFFWCWVGLACFGLVICFSFVFCS